MQKQKATTDHLGLVRSHFDAILKSGRGNFGPDPTAMWLSSLDTRTHAYPADDSRPDHIPKRVYRNIDAPKGASLYWDQASVVAAHALTAVTGEQRYVDAVDAYVGDFLNRCVATNGLFLWGNHYYFDVFRGCPVWFAVDDPPKPCFMPEEVGALHETRPIPPAWETFWRVSPEATERCIRQIGHLHVVDPQTGCFNRHADQRRSCAFLESGGIIAESLGWLSKIKGGDPALVELALKVARYNFNHRDAVTGLLENNPTETRWDKHCCTTEVGLWAGSLLRAETHTGNEEFQSMADAALRAYLKYGFDPQRQQFYGALQVSDGAPVREHSTPYQPGTYTDFWKPLFPAHDYPFCLAEACLALFQRTGEALYEEAVTRWVECIRRELPANRGRGAYAEHYGRGVHFLLGAADALPQTGARALAHQLAGEAVEVLFAHGMFRTHPGENRYDAVDGPGFLLLALIYLETGTPPQGMGFGF